MGGRFTGTPGHTPPPPEDKPYLAAKYRAIKAGDYRRFQRIRAAEVRRRTARRRLRGAARIGRGGARRLKRLVNRHLYYRAQRRRPIDEQLAVFAAYWFRGYACNPAAIYEKLRETVPHIRPVWAVKPGGLATLPEGAEFVLFGSAGYYRALARAKYFVNNVNFPDEYVKRPGQVHMMTQHGTPLKKMGLDQMEYPVGAKEMDFDALIARSDRWDFLISSNPLSTEVWERAFPCRYEVLEIGYPRNDRLVAAGGDEDERSRLRAGLGVPAEATAILYAPTHRDYQRTYSPMFDIGRVMDRLGDDHVLLLRAHYYYKIQSMAADAGWPADRVIDVSGHPSVADLALASDVLLTDYSSIMFDYAVLGRPIVIYANDWETYKRTRGVNFELTASPPGVVATTEDELVDAFLSRAPWSDAAAKRLADFRARFCPWDDGRAAERAVRRMFLNEKIENPPQ